MKKLALALLTAISLGALAHGQAPDQRSLRIFLVDENGTVVPASAAPSPKPGGRSQNFLLSVPVRGAALTITADEVAADGRDWVLYGNVRISVVESELTGVR